MVLVPGVSPIVYFQSHPRFQIAARCLILNPGRIRVWGKQQHAQLAYSTAWICGGRQEMHEVFIKKNREALMRLGWSCEGFHEKQANRLIQGTHDAREAVVLV